MAAPQRAQFGFFLLRADRRDEAGAVFEQSIDQNPRCANAWFGLGLLAEGKGDHRTALRNYDRALIYNPSDLEACLRSANIMISRGDAVHAIEDAAKGRKPGPGQV